MLASRPLGSMLLGLGLATWSFAGCGKAPETPDDGGGGAGGSATVPAPRRVVGYLPTWRSLSPQALDFDTLTHLCVAFANPTGEGSTSDFETSARTQIQPLVEAAHAKGVNVMASIAGGTKESGELVGAQITEANVDAYVSGLLDLVERYDLDGIDVDIEGEAVTERYEPFVLKLAAALPAEKVLSAAVTTSNGVAFSTPALEAYDFINIMSYDHCGWSVEACEHAPLEESKKELAYWTSDRGLPRDRVVLGVPFYGWCWGCADKQTALTYAQIVAQYPDAKTSDWIATGGVEISLNSAATIATKAELAKDYGGVMIWELGQDATGDDALIRVIAGAQ